MLRQPLPDGLYCPNPTCPRFGQEEGRQLERHAYYGDRPTTQYLCRGCGKTFTETKGTFFYRLRTPRAKVLQGWRWWPNKAGSGRRVERWGWTKIRSNAGWIGPVGTSRKSRRI